MPNARRREKCCGCHRRQRRVLPLTLIASVRGMKLAFPFDRDTTAFWVIIASLAVILGGMVAYFRRRGWL